MLTREESLLIAISGPSGAGKSSLCTGLVHRHDSYRLSISATTRPPRAGETHGEEYTFYKPQDFLVKKERGEFAEWAVVHNHYYGTPRDFIDEGLATGKSVVFDIDVQGSMQIRESYPECILVFVIPPSLRVLRERLEGRKTDSPEVIETRMMNALKELTYIDRFDCLIVNDVLEQAHQDVETILAAEKLRVVRTNWQGFLEGEE